MCIGEIHMYILSALSLLAELKALSTAFIYYLLKFCLGNSMKVGVADYIK